MDTPTRYRRFSFRGQDAIVLETDEEMETFNMNYDAQDDKQARGYIYREFCSRKTIGAYVFNRFGVCLNPVVTFHYKVKSQYPWMKVKVALAMEEPMGFSYGIDCMLTSCGCGSPVGDETDELFSTKEEATIDGLRYMRNYIEKSSEKSKGKLFKVIDEEIEKLEKIVQSKELFEAIAPNHQQPTPELTDYTKEPMHVVFIHAAEGNLRARKQFFETCYLRIQECIAVRPDMDVNTRLIVLLMENDCMTDESQSADLRRLCAQANEQWHERFAARLNKSQMQLFFTT
jgi:hypothetical protein